MTRSTTTTAPQPARLLDAHCNHWRQHGRDLYEAGPTGSSRGETRLAVVSARQGSVGGPAGVRVTMFAGALQAGYRLTPDDAEAVAQWLLSAAAMAREVTAQVEAGACK